MTSENKNYQLHQPVLLKAVLRYLNPQPGESYLDLTAGYGGHARAVIGRTNAPEKAVLVDRDEQAIATLTKEFAAQGSEVIRSDFASAAEALIERGATFDLVLADLGVSSPQLDQAERGFSFGQSGPLDMRMDRRQELTAAEIVNQYSEQALAKILRDYGEEPKAERLARAIIAGRPYASTADLAEVVARHYRRLWKSRSKAHPATRTFQAIRIATNQELDQVERLLPCLTQLLKPGGRVAVISFHSLEDRLVKRYFKEEVEAGYEAELQLLTKHVVAGADEDVNNPRARSAKLRAGVKINTKGADSHADSGQK